MTGYIAFLFVIPAIMFLGLGISARLDPQLSSTARFSFAVSIPFLTVSLVCLAMHFAQ